MTAVLIGAGGWAYFHVPREEPLVAYAKAFDFVEVNSTFYEYPDMRTVRSWRRKTLGSFEFAVRCHRDVAHKERLQPSSGNVASLERLLEICEALNATVLHVLVPPGLGLRGESVVRIRDLFGSVDMGRVRVALETSRGRAPVDPRLVKIMQDLNMVHCVDLSQRDPAYKSDLLYTRLFGPREDNVYQFTDEELKEVNNKASKTEFEKSVLAFHGVKMYKDAARLKTYKSTGSFPMVTSNVGLRSLQEVLTEDQPFPASKTTLMGRQGWKMIDLNSEQRVPAAKMLANLPNRRYASINDVLRTLTDRASSSKKI